MTKLNSKPLRTWSLYALFAIAWTCLGVIFQPSNWKSDAQLHTLMELTATLLATAVGTISLIRFYAQKKTAYLFVGIGFLGTALLDGYHAVVTSVYFSPDLPPELATLIPGNWNASRIFLPALLTASWWTTRREQQSNSSKNISEKKIYLFAGLLTLGSFLFSAIAPLPRFYYFEFFFPRPEEFIAGALFLFALGAHLQQGEWNKDTFERGLTLSLVLGAVSQIVVMSRSSLLFDAMFDLAHVMKILSYLCVLTGLLINSYHLFHTTLKSHQVTSGFESLLQQEAIRRELIEDKFVTTNHLLKLQQEDAETSRVAASDMLHEMEISRQKLLESEAAANEQSGRVKAIFDGASDGIITVDVHGIVESVNPAAERIFGYSAKEALGQNINMLIHQTHHEEQADCRQAYLETGIKEALGGLGNEAIGKRKDGRTMPIELAFSEIRLQDNRLFTGFIRDITARKQAEKELKQTLESLSEQKEAAEDSRNAALELMHGMEVARHKLKKSEAAALEQATQTKAIFDNAIDPILTVNGAGTIDSLNKAAENIFGYSAEELIGQNIRVLMPTHYAQKLDAYLQEHRETEDKPFIGINRELMGKRKAGSAFPIDLAISEVTIDGQQLYTGIIRDITERKEAEQQQAVLNQEISEQAQLLEITNTTLEHSNEELKQFAYVASHDLQEPLRKVNSFCQLLQEEYSEQLDDNARTYIRFAMDGATRMRALISDLLDYSRVETQGKPLTETDAAGACALAMENLQGAIDECGAEVSIRPLPTFLADQAQLVRLFQNLIGNAIKYRGEKTPVIQVEAQEQDDQHWLITIKDNGIGMEAQYFEKIFVMFQRLHARGEYQGTGIGLAICKRIVDRMGGANLGRI